MRPELRWGARTYVMGILNLTPDSFSGDGLAPAGRSIDEVVAAALDQARQFVDAGADILDIGAESSRPAQFYGEHRSISADEELALAIPVVSAVVGELGDRALVSIDTTKSPVARAAVEAGASIVNDVWAARRDSEVAIVAADAGAHLVLMHNQEHDDYPGGVFDAVVAWLTEAIDAAEAAGVARGRLIVDPGIGFGKTPAHSVELLHRLRELKVALGDLPVLVGTSRKRFIGELLGGAPPDQRLEGTAASVALAIAAGADIVRVHDAEPIVKTTHVSDAIVRWRPPEEAANGR
jgi:dihydropteroate synthase